MINRLLIFADGYMNISSKNTYLGMKQVNDNKKNLSAQQYLNFLETKNEQIIFGQSWVILFSFH